MIGLFGSTLLIVLGALCTTKELSKYRPSIQLVLEGLSPFRGYLGLACASYGIILTIQILLQIPIIHLFPFIYLASLSAAILAVVVGFLMGYETLAARLQPHLPEKTWAYIDALHKSLQKDQSSIGFAALSMGAFHALLFLIPETLRFSMFGM